MHMIIWTDGGKALDKNPTFFNDKKLNKQGKKGTLCNLIEGIYENPRTEIHLTPKNLPLRSGPVQVASHTTATQHYTECASQGNKAGNRIKKHPN